MIQRTIFQTLLLTGIFAVVGWAAPETIVFKGIASGSVGTTVFTNQAFSFTFKTDTTAIAPGTFCCTDNLTTPPGTPASFTIANTASGNLTGIQGVFVNESEAQMGMWMYDTQDWLDILVGIGSYGLTSNFGPVSGTTFIFPNARPMPSTAGPITFLSVSGVTATVTVATDPPVTPVITSATTAYGSGISQNTWIAIRGNHLVNSDTQAYGVYWTGVQEYTGDQMSTSLNGVSVTVNGKPAYISFYCTGAAPSSVCSQDQINALTPLDATTGPIQIVVTNSGVSSAPFSVNMTPLSPAFLMFRGNAVAATHANYRLLGAATLYPGYSTPASVGETIVLWATGFGMPTTALTAGSAKQSAPLPAFPTCQIGGATATVVYAGVVSPGLYQLNVVVPNGATNGDNSVNCTYGGYTTQTGTVINVSR